MQFVHRFNVHFIQDGSDTAIDDGLAQGGWDLTAVAVDQTELPYLLLQAHLREQFADLFFDGRWLLWYERHGCMQVLGE